MSILEEARAVVGKEAADLRSSLQEVERSRLEARRELQELRRQVRRLLTWAMAVVPFWAARTKHGGHLQLRRGFGVS